jgi:hypothetical protein
MFGLELRKKGNFAALHSDAKEILLRAGVSGSDISSAVKRAAVAHSLQKMLSQKHFSICTITDCQKVVGLVIPAERMAIYQAQHCVDWSDMLPDFRQVLVAMILDDFGEVLSETKTVSPEVK